MKCPMGEYCAKEDKKHLPNYGITAFDNIMQAWLTIFQCISLEGWTDIMYHTMDALTVWSWVYFVFMIVFGSFFAVNLALAVLYVFFVGANAPTHDEQKLAEEHEASEASKVEASAAQGNVPVMPQKTGFVGVMHRVATSKRFEYLTVGLICANTVVMAAEYNNMPTVLKDVFEGINTFLFAYFVLEMLIKLIGFGPRGYVKDSMNVFDGTVVLVSCVEVILGAMSGGEGSNNLPSCAVPPAHLQAGRSWKQLNEIISTMIRSLAGISYLSLILLLFMFIFALLGMQLFGYEFVFCDEYGLDEAGGARATCPAGLTDVCPKHFDCYAPCDASLVGQWVTFDDSGAGGLCQRYSGAKWDPTTREDRKWTTSTSSCSVAKGTRGTTLTTSSGRSSPSSRC